MEFEPNFHSEKNKKEEETIKDEKQQKWEEEKRKVEKLEDKLGLEVDEPIKETVVALNVNELPTRQSCGGHLKRGESYPWVMISASDKPKNKFIDEEKIFKSIAQGEQFSYKEIKDPWNYTEWGSDQFEKLMKLRTKAIRKAEERGVTEEYQKWKEENRKIGKKLEDLLTEFYEEAEREGAVLKIEDVGDMAGRLYSITEDEWDDLSDEDKKSVLKERREEMKKFTEFLKDKFFNKK
ncbi:MAG: hypothetical protein ACQEP3_01820 [Patescibacteria group bacterium]